MKQILRGPQTLRRLARLHGLPALGQCAAAWQRERAARKDAEFYRERLGATVLLIEQAQGALKSGAIVEAEEFIAKARLAALGGSN